MTSAAAALVVQEAEAAVGRGPDGARVGHRLPLDSDVVELLTVGIDVGSATFHATVSRVVCERRAQSLSTRYDVVARELVADSPVAFTPYLASEDPAAADIDADAVAGAVRRFFADSGVDPEQVDSGVVLLTGSALLRHNARALAERLAGSSGRFVCAAAGHHFEASLAAHGSGAVARSRDAGVPVVSLDVGGATTKLALAVDGEVRATAALGVGARLLAWDRSRRLVRVEGSVLPFARGAGVEVRVGSVLDPDGADRLSELMAAAVVGALEPPATAGHDAVGDGVLLTAPFPVPDGPFEIVASGGVAELFGPGAGERTFDPGDLGPHLARALFRRLGDRGLGGRLRLGSQRIRATVVGASQYSTQVSGSTVAADPASLPLHHVPVVRPPFDLGTPRGPDPRAVAAALAGAVRDRFVTGQVPEVVAVALGWRGEPTYRRLRALAEGMTAGQRDAGVPTLLVAVDADVAASLGRIARCELGAPPGAFLCLDSLDLADLDFVDVGTPLLPAKVVPVVVKSLLFGGGAPAPVPGAGPRHDGGAERGGHP